MLHMLDLAMNAAAAGASTIRISVCERADGRLGLLVADNGRGMSPELVAAVLDRLATTKTKRSGWSGFGIALLRTTVDLVGGTFSLISRPGRGTLVRCEMPADHIDLPPLGDVAGSLQALLTGCSEVDLCYTHRIGERSFRFDTRPLRRELGEVFGTRTVQLALAEHVREGEQSLALGGLP